MKTCMDAWSVIASIICFPSSIKSYLSIISIRMLTKFSIIGRLLLSFCYFLSLIFEMIVFTVLIFILVFSSSGILIFAASIFNKIERQPDIPICYE